MWDFISQGIWPFAAGFGLGFFTAALLVVPSLAAALAKIKIGDIPGHEKLSERKRDAVDELVAVLSLHGPTGARPDRDSVDRMLNSPYVNSVIAIGDGIAEPVLALIRAFDQNDEAEYAKAIEECRETCRYVQLVDSASGNAVATFSMKLVAPLALAAERRGRTFGARYRRWKAHRQLERQRERLEETIAPRIAARISKQSAPSPPPAVTAIPTPPQQTATATPSPGSRANPA
jgi:hypothetical protein